MVEWFVVPFATFELYFILGLSLPGFLKLGKNGEGEKGIEMAVPKGSIFE